MAAAVLIASTAGARRVACPRPRRRRADPRRARRDVRGGLPRARLGRPGVRRVLPRRHADRRAASLRLGSRPAARGRQAPRGRRRRSTRCGRSRGCSPGRRRGSTCPAGTASGSALEAYRAAHGEAGLDVLARLYRAWPFFDSLLDNAELSLAKADMGVARLYARAGDDDGDERRWATIEAEHARAVQLLLRVTGRERLLDDAPVLQRSIALRNPYVDSLSELQVRLLARLRSLEPDDPARETRAPARPADRQRGRRRPAEHRLRERMDHADHVGLLRAGSTASPRGSAGRISVPGAARSRLRWPTCSGPV